METTRIQSTLENLPANIPDHIGIVKSPVQSLGYPNWPVVSLEYCTWGKQKKSLFILIHCYYYYLPAKYGAHRSRNVIIMLENSGFIRSPYMLYPRGVTPHINRQGGQWLKKIITPKKYLNSTKNTPCGERCLAWPTARARYIGNTPQNYKILMIFNKIMLHHPKKHLNSGKNTWNMSASRENTWHLDDP